MRLLRNRDDGGSEEERTLRDGREKEGERDKHKRLASI
jgi:hypothetical protein